MCSTGIERVLKRNKTQKKISQNTKNRTVDQGISGYSPVFIFLVHACLYAGTCCIKISVRAVPLLV